MSRSVTTIAAQEVEVMAAVDRLQALATRNSLPSHLLEELTTADLTEVLAPVLRWNTGQHRLLIILQTGGFVVALVAAPLVSVWLWGWWLGLPWDWTRWILAVLECLGIGVLSRALRRGRRPRRIALTILVLFGGASTTAIVWFQRRGIPLEFLPGLMTAFVIYVLLALSLAELASTIVGLRPQSIHPADVLTVDLILLTDRACSWSADCTDSASRRSRLIRDLEQCAARVERSYSKLATFGDSDLRQWSNHRGRQIGAVVRAHKQLVVDPPFHNRESVPRSLSNTLSAILRRDWDALLIIDPQPKLASALRKHGPRIALALVLFGAAILFPHYLPQMVGSNADSFTATLIITALLMLVAPDPKKAQETLTRFSGR
jgi:hypothetical protein